MLENPGESNSKSWHTTSLGEISEYSLPVGLPPYKIDLDSLSGSATKTVVENHRPILQLVPPFTTEIPTNCREIWQERRELQGSYQIFTRAPDS